MDFPITMADAHTFAQGLIAAGWHNDNLDCVDTLQRQLEAFMGARMATPESSTETPYVSPFNPIDERVFRCPVCCSKKGEAHAMGCSEPTLTRNATASLSVLEAREAIEAALTDAKQSKNISGTADAPKP